MPPEAVAELHGVGERVATVLALTDTELLGVPVALEEADRLVEPVPVAHSVREAEAVTLPDVLAEAGGLALPLSVPVPEGQVEAEGLGEPVAVTNGLALPVSETPGLALGEMLGEAVPAVEALSLGEGLLLPVPPHSPGLPVPLPELEPQGVLAGLRVTLGHWLPLPEADSEPHEEGVCEAAGLSVPVSDGVPEAEGKVLLLWLTVVHCVREGLAVAVMEGVGL